jgi:hypothetical protein
MDCAVIYSEAALADLQQITAFIARMVLKLRKGLQIGWWTLLNRYSQCRSVGGR